MPLKIELLKTETQSKEIQKRQDARGIFRNKLERKNKSV